MYVERSIQPILLAAVLLLTALPASARERRSTFQTQFASGASCTVQLRHLRGTRAKAAKTVPHRIFVQRPDGTRLLYNLSTDKVYLRTPAKGRRRAKTTLVENDRVMFLLRGCSGSGKSTLARTLAPGAKVMSTDDYFMKNGRYVFDIKSLGKAHGWNQKRAANAAKAGEKPLVIDNTFTRAWEARAYVEAALEHGYRIELREPNTPWKFNAKELARRNSHGVSEQIIRGQISHYEHGITVADVLKADRR